MNRLFLMLIAVASVWLAACQKGIELSPTVDDYVHVKVDGAYLPLWVRGNTSSKKILLYIAGGPGGSAIDFAKVDYAGWKESLEQDVAIAYYDQRGTGNNQGTFDLESVTLDQYAADIHHILQILQQQYPEAELYLFGHSFGGYLAYHYMIQYEEDALIDGCISFNGPATTDHDPERWGYRWAYLNRVAKDNIADGIDTVFWQEALSWTEAHPDIETDEEKRAWNIFVAQAVVETERPITVSEALGVLFFSPYNYFSAYAYGKLDQVEARIFEDEKSQRLIERLPLIDQRIFLITGEYDDIAPPEEMEAVLEAMSSSDKELVIIPDAGHDPSIDQPEMFVKEVLDFVRE